MGITEAAFWGWLLTDRALCLGRWQMRGCFFPPYPLFYGSHPGYSFVLTTCLCSKWMIGIKYSPGQSDGRARPLPFTDRR